MTTSASKPNEKARPGDVLERLRKLIEHQQLQPSMKLPPERILAEQLKVGRPAVREAIKALQVLDVVSSRHGDGTYIKSLVGLSGGWPPKGRLVDANFDMIELLEVRKMIEPRAAALAATRATPRQVAEIERELLAQEARPDDPAVLERHDYLFHEASSMPPETRCLLVWRGRLRHNC
jgi:GntR family transcriptional repressor for pyruvate dehydrogenase complex